LSSSFFVWQNCARGWLKVSGEVWPAINIIPCFLLETVSCKRQGMTFCTVHAVQGFCWSRFECVGNNAECDYFSRRLSDC
jgi:hypothetical protein